MPSNTPTSANANAQAETHINDEASLADLDLKIEQLQLDLEVSRGQAAQSRSIVDEALRNENAGLMSPYATGFTVGTSKAILKALRELVVPKCLMELEVVIAGRSVALEIMYMLRTKMTGDGEDDQRLQIYLESVCLHLIEEQQKGAGKVSLEEIARRDVVGMSFQEIFAARQKAASRIGKIYQEYGDEYLALFEDDY